MAGARRRLRTLEDFCTYVETGIEALPEFFRLLRPYIDSDHAAFFHADEHGRICGAFHEISVHMPQASEFIKRARTGTDARRPVDPPSVARMFQMTVPMQLLRFDSVAAEESALYRDVIGPIGGRHVLRVGLRIRGSPAGLMALVRGRTARSFTDEDIQRALKAVRPLRRLICRPPADDERLLVSEGVLILSPEGTPVHGSSEGWRLWELVQDPRFLPFVDGSELLASVIDRRSPGDTERRVSVRTGSGDFELIVVPLRAATKKISLDGCLLRIQHRVLARILYLQRMNELALSPMQKLVCLALLQGRTHANIADDYGIGLQTVITHVRGVYAKAGVANRTELLAKFGDRPSHEALTAKLQRGIRSA